MLLLATQLFWAQGAIYSLQPTQGVDYTNFKRCTDEITVRSFLVNIQSPYSYIGIYAPEGFELLGPQSDGWSTYTSVYNSSDPNDFLIQIRLAQGVDPGIYSGEVTTYGNNASRKAENKSGAARTAFHTQSSLFVSGEICGEQPCTPPNAPSIFTYDRTTLCERDYVYLRVNGNSESDYNWYKDGELIKFEYPYFDFNRELYISSGSVSAIYTATITVNGCESGASNGIELTVLPKQTTPIITGAESRVVCPGSSITLTASIEQLETKQTNLSSRISDLGESRYFWYRNDGSDDDDYRRIQLEGEGSSITVTEPGNYYVQYVNSNGCYSDYSSEITVTMGALPTTPIISAGGNATFCAGGNVTLTSTPSNSYLWSNGATTRSITVDSSALYSVVVNNGNCNSLSSVARKVTVNPIPKTPTISTSGSTSICSGKTVTLTSSSATGNVWSTGANTQSITVGLAGTYTVTATNLSCTSPRSEGVTISINALPTRPTITASGATTFCAGGSVTLTSSATNNVWSNGSTEKSIIVSSAGTYSVTTSNGCASLTSLGRTVVVNQLPPTPTISVIGSTNLSMGGSVTLTSSYSTANKWSTGATVRTITVTTPGTYSVSFTGSTCPSKPSLPVIITQNTIENTAKFSNSTENGTTAFSSKMSIYPNPSKGIFNIETDTTGDVYIVNQLGQVVKEVKVEANVVNTINAENLAKGIYLVKQSNKSQSSKLIIQN